MTAADPAAVQDRLARLEHTLKQRDAALAALAPSGRSFPGVGAVVGAQGVIVVLALGVVGAALLRPGAPTPAEPPSEPPIAAVVPVVEDEPAVEADAEPIIEEEPAVEADAEPIVEEDPVVEEEPVTAVEPVVEPEPVVEAEPLAPVASGPPILATIGSFPKELTGTTVGSKARTAGAYSCAPDIAEGGPEAWYKVEVPETGFLTAWLVEEPRVGVDVDVHLLAAPSPDACLQRHAVAIGKRVQPGTYWLVVDTWTGQGAELPGAFTLRVDLERD